MKIQKFILINLFLVFSFFFANIVKAISCSDPGAPWNQATGSKFTCVSGIKYGDDGYVTLKPTTATCSNKSLICAKAIDCGSTSDTSGYQCVKKGDDYCTGGTTPDRKSYHCPYGNDYVCTDCKKGEALIDVKDIVNIDKNIRDNQNNVNGNNASSTGTRLVSKENNQEIINRDTTGINCCTGFVVQKSDENYTLDDFMGVGIAVYNCIFCVIGALCLLALVAGGVIWITSGGSADKVGLGKKIIISAVIGVIISFSSVLIVRFVLDAVASKDAKTLIEEKIDL